MKWSLEDVRLHRDKAIGDLVNKNSVAEKDNAGKTEFLSYPSDHPGDEKIITTVLDLTDVQGLIFVAIQVDDLALLTVKEKPTDNQPSGHILFEATYQVDGTALWRAERSYKEFPTPIPGGHKYDLTIKYKNTANLTAQYNGLIDFDGVNVFLMHHPAVDLDVDSDNTEGFEFTWGDDKEDKIEADPSLPGKIIAVPIEPDADHDGIPDYKDFVGITPGPEKQFVQMVVHLPPNYDPETATVTFDYTMSASTNSSSTEPPNSGFRIWTKNGNAQRSLNAIPAAPDESSGYLVKSGESILWKNLATQCNLNSVKVKEGVYPGPALVLYLETVITYTGGSLSTSQPEQIKVTAKNGSTGDDSKTEDVVNITVRCTGGVQLSGVKALLVNDDDDNGDGVSDKDNDRLGFLDDDVQPITVTVTALDQAVKVTIDSNQLYTTVGPTPSGSGGLIDGVYPGKRLTNGAASGSDADGQSKIGWKEGIYTIDVPANSTIVQNLYIEGLRASAAFDDVVIDAVILMPSVPAGKKLSQATTTAGHKLTVLGAEIMPDVGQSGKTGDQIASNKGVTGEKHYVSPKKSAEIADEFVVLKAKDITKELFEQVLEWECAPAANGSVDPNDSTKYRVKRDATGKTVVKLKTKDGGLEVDLVNVWVVWVSLTPKTTGESVLTKEVKLGNNSVRFANAYEPKAGIEWTGVIAPAEIITDPDHPAFKGQPRALIPGGPDLDGGVAKGSMFSGWDVSRRIRDRWLYGNEMKDPIEKYTMTTANTVVSVPFMTPSDFPVDPVEGNDDKSSIDEDSDPYMLRVGKLVSIDRPGLTLFDDQDYFSKIPGEDGDVLRCRLRFREFTRVQIGSKWYTCSNYEAWRFDWAAIRKSGKWQDDKNIPQAFDFTDPNPLDF